MAIDQAFVGRSYPPSDSYQVSRAKIREFADAIGDDSPVYRDPAVARAQGHPDVIAPPTFATLVNIKAVEAIVGDPELGVDYSMMVHADQRFAHHRPICAGDELAVVTHIDSILSRAGIDTLSVRAELGTTGGEAVCTIRATLVFRQAEEAAK